MKFDHFKSHSIDSPIMGLYTKYDLVRLNRLWIVNIEVKTPPNLNHSLPSPSPCLLLICSSIFNKKSQEII